MSEVVGWCAVYIFRLRVCVHVNYMWKKASKTMPSVDVEYEWYVYSTIAESKVVVVVLKSALMVGRCFIAVAMKLVSGLLKTVSSHTINALHSSRLAVVLRFRYPLGRTSREQPAR